MGSATREQALAMLKAKEDELLAATANTTAEKDQAKKKKARATTAFVTNSSEILKRHEQLGHSEPPHLNIDALYAFSVNVDPQCSNT